MPSSTNQKDTLDFQQRVLERLQKGDIEALGVLYEYYIDYLIDVGLYYVRDTELLEDEIHDLFLELYTSRHRLLEIRNIKAYLATTLKNNLLRRIKKKEVVIEEDRFIYLLGIESERLEESAEKKWIDLEQHQNITSELKLAMDSLTNHQQHILQLRFKENLSFNEIAEALSISKTSARTLLYRSLKALRKRI